MAQTTVNPYSEIGGYIPTGLNSIIGAISTPPTIDSLVNAVAAFIGPIFYATAGGVSTEVEIEIKSVARTAINSYVNSLVFSGEAGYNQVQMRFIRILLGNAMTSNLPIVSIGNRIQDVEDNLTDSGLNVSEQTALLLATTIGTNANTYWTTQVGSTTSPWKSFFPPAPENYTDIPFYVEAAMNGAIAGYGATPAGMIEPSVNFVTNKMVSALIGALTVTAGKIFFQWIQRITHDGFSIAMGGGGNNYSFVETNRLCGCGEINNCRAGGCGSNPPV